ncbi:MAG TPA: hypothetical protein VFZ33_06340 [Chitinophagaceae bacterium]
MPVTDIESIWLYTKAADLNEIKNYASYVFNFRDVHATTSISTMTIGGMNNRMGFVGTAIKEYAYNDATGNFHLGNLPPDYANNSIRVDRCAFITFALNVAYGEAWHWLTYIILQSQKLNPGRELAIQNFRSSVMIGFQVISKHK